MPIHKQLSGQPICRRLFVVLLADYDHGESMLMSAMLAAGLGEEPSRKGARLLFSPGGREISAYLFTRPYQETERKKFRSVEEALDGNDPKW